MCTGTFPSLRQIREAEKEFLRTLQSEQVLAEPAVTFRNAA